MTDNLTRWINDLYAGRLPDKRRQLPPYSPPQVAEPQKKSAAQYAKEVAQGFKASSSHVSSNASIYMLDSTTILPDEQTAKQVAAILDKLVKRDIAQRNTLYPADVDEAIRSSFTVTSQGVTFSYKADHYQYLQNIRWDLIISHIKDQSPSGPAGGRS